jgi:hypothetical protein
MMPSDEFKVSLNAFMLNMTDVEMSKAIHRLQTAEIEMSPEERDLTLFAHRFLMKLSSWSLWEAVPTAHVPLVIHQLQELPYSDEDDNYGLDLTAAPQDLQSHDLPKSTAALHELEVLGVDREGFDDDFHLHDFSSSPLHLPLDRTDDELIALCCNCNSLCPDTRALYVARLGCASL